MRAVRYHEHGGTDVLQVDDIDRPAPAADDLLVRVEAAGINPVDTYFREGEYPVPGLPWTPGSDVAGVVAAVGEGVEGFAEGDRVVATGLGRTEPGTCAEYVAVPQGLAAHLPRQVDFAEAAAGALVGVTAWQALVAHADLEPAETCLIHGGSGGVGHVAVQLAAAMGANVVTTASPESHGRLRGLGADAAFDYRRDDLAEAIVEVGEPDVILDVLANENLPLDAEVAAHGARIVVIGNTEAHAPLPMGPGKFKDLTFQAMSMFNTPDMGGVLARLNLLAANGSVVTEVAREYSLAETAQAHEAVMGERIFGKLVVRP
jgi:NADPH2:quinone reductase